MSELNPDQLLRLYFNFTRFRDSSCNGCAKMTVQEFYKTFCLKEAAL